MNAEAMAIAWQLRMAIEQRQPHVPNLTQDLVNSLGGIADLREMTPGAAAIYLTSLLLTQSQ